MKLGEKGFTLIELLVAAGIAALIGGAATTVTFHVLRNTEYERNQMTAVSQVENAGYWISLDAQKAQAVEAEGLGGAGERSVIVSWEQDESGNLESSDALYFAFSGDGGGTWGSDIEAFHNDNPPSNFSYTIPDQYVTNNFRMRFYLNGPSGWIGTDGGNECAYLDDIAISEAIFSDACSSFANWDNGSHWNASSGKFRGYGSGSSVDRLLTLTDSLDLSSYQGETVTVSWDHSSSGPMEADDYFYFAFSSDNGSTWSGDIEAFHGPIGSTPQPFSYTVPQEYLTAQFKMGFFVDFSWSDENVYLDNIAISVPIFSDDCSSFANWDGDDRADWNIYYGEEFRGHHYGGSESERYLAMNTSLDLSTEVFAAGFPLTFTWTAWSESGGTEHQVIYSMVDGRLMRSHSIIVDGVPTETTETLVAQHIDPYSSNCQFANGKLTFTVKATVGAGPVETSETREFQVLTRPD